MKICFTSMNCQALMGVLDLNSKELSYLPNLHGKNPYKPFGMTWNKDQFFIAQSTSIVDLDGLPIIKDLWDGIHQIVWKDDFLYMVSPHISCLKRYSFESKKMDYLNLKNYTFKSEPPLACKGQDKIKFRYDLHHFNSILIKNNKAYISAHNNNDPSFILELEYPSFGLIKTHRNMGHKIHGIYVEDDEIYTVDSGRSGCIVSNKGQSITTYKTDYMFARGLAVSKDYFITSYFPEETRRNRKNGNAVVVVINKSTKSIEESITIRNVGSICDVRILDEYDYCHMKKPYAKLDEILNKTIPAIEAQTL